MKKNAARFQVDFELLKQALHLPEDAKIGHVATHDPISCWIYVEHPDLPEVLPGDQWPEARPEFESIETYHPVYQDIFVDWGINDE